MRAISRYEVISRIYSDVFSDYLVGAHMIAMLDVSKDIASEARTHMQNIKHCMAKPYDLMSRPLSNKAFSRKKAEDDADLLELSLEVEPSDAPIVAPGPFESRPGRSRFAQERPQRCKCKSFLSV
jgi:hypothetical protein